MNKNLLSIAIILLAVAIVFVNLWKSPLSKENENANEKTKTEASENDKIPGTDLTQVLEGKPAPEFELNTLNGEVMKLSDYRGKKVILNFWASWCPPCRAEMPHMQNFYQENKDNGIEIVAVNMTNIDHGQSAIKDFVKEFGLTFTIPLDEDGTIGMQYQAFTIPTSYIIDSKGVITKKIIGPMDEEMMMNVTKDIH